MAWPGDNPIGGAVEIAKNQRRNVRGKLGLFPELLYRIQSFPADITTFHFGSKFKGEHNVWILQFNIDQPEIYKLDNDPIGLLKQDFDSIPVNVTLEETALFQDQCFKTSDTEHCNIVFKLIT